MELENKYLSQDPEKRESSYWIVSLVRFLRRMRNLRCKGHCAKESIGKLERNGKVSADGADIKQFGFLPCFFLSLACFELPLLTCFSPTFASCYLLQKTILCWVMKPIFPPSKCSLISDNTSTKYWKPPNSSMSIQRSSFAREMPCPSLPKRSPSIHPIVSIHFSMTVQALGIYAVLLSAVKHKWSS